METRLTQAVVGKTLTLRAKPARGALACVPDGALMPARRYLWYYIASWPDGRVAATLHPGEGILVAGAVEPWRIMRRDDIHTLLMPSPVGGVPLASLFVAGAGLFGRTCRITHGEERTGGYALVGKGWRGGVLLRAGDGARLLMLGSEGDPPTLYRMEPIPDAEAVPLPIALLVAYLLLEREIRQGSFVKRPDAAESVET